MGPSQGKLEEIALNDKTTHCINIVSMWCGIKYLSILYFQLSMETHRRTLDPFHLVLVINRPWNPREEVMSCRFNQLTSKKGGRS